MAVIQRIQVQGAGVVGRNKLGPDVVLWEAMVHTQILNPWCKAFIKPQMGPPLLYTQETVQCSSTGISAGQSKGKLAGIFVYN